MKNLTPFKFVKGLKIGAIIITLVILFSGWFSSLNISIDPNDLQSFRLRNYTICKVVKDIT